MENETMLAGMHLMLRVSAKPRKIPVTDENYEPKSFAATYRNGKLNWLKLLCRHAVVVRNHSTYYTHTLTHAHGNYFGKVNRSAASQHDYINEQF